MEFRSTKDMNDPNATKNDPGSMQSQAIGFNTNSFSPKNYRPQVNNVASATGVVDISPTNMSSFSPFQSNWNRSSSFSNTQSSGSLQYSRHQPQFPATREQQPLGNYKNLDSLDLHFQNMSTTLKDGESSSGIADLTLSTNQSYEDTDFGSIDVMNKLEYEIKQRDEMINRLQLENNNLKLSLKTYDIPNNRDGLPISHYKLFQTLSNNMRQLQEKSDENEIYLESLLTAISINPSQSVTETGRYDIEEMAHKIIVKIKSLQEENEQMLKMLSYGRSKQKDIEMVLLRAKIVDLDQIIQQLRKQFKKTNP